MLAADVPVITAPGLFDAAHIAVGLVNGVTITLTIEFSGAEITAVHLRPGLTIDPQNQEAWSALEKLLGFGR